MLYDDEPKQIYITSCACEVELRSTRRVSDKRMNGANGLVHGRTTSGAGVFIYVPRMHRSTYVDLHTPELTVICVLNATSTAA